MKGMENRKRLGKGIEDISHFFLSSSKSSDLKRPLSEDKSPIGLSSNRHRIIAVTSQTPKMPAMYWSSQLAIALSECGENVLMVDVGTKPDQLASLLNPIVIYPSFVDFLNQPDTTITVEAPGGFRVLSFQILLEELRQFDPKDCERLFGVLLDEEQDADVLLLNIDFDLMQTDLISHLQCLQEVVLVVSSDDLLGAYRVLKVLRSIRPELCVGLIEYGASRSDFRGTMQQLVLASKKFLQTSPVILGTVPLNVSITGRGPMVEISKIILHDLSSQESQRLFFEQVQASMQ